MFHCSVSSGPSQNLRGMHIGRGDHIHFERQILKKHKVFFFFVRLIKIFSLTGCFSCMKSIFTMRIFSSSV